MSWDRNHNHNHYTLVQEGFFKPSQKQDKKFIWKPATRHLNKKNWEVYVLDSNKESTERFNESAACLLNGRIVISTGLVDSLKSDAELASVIAHEVSFPFSNFIPSSFSFLLVFYFLFYLFIFSIRLDMLRVDIDQKLK